MRSLGLVLTLFTGCGRIGFEARVGDANADGISIDAPLPEPGLLFWYELDTPPSPLVADSSRYGLHAQCGSFCGTVVPGQRGNAYLFDGDDVLRIESSAQHELTTATAALWLRLDALTPPYNFVIGKPFDAGSVSNTWELFVDNMSMVRAGGDSVAAQYCFGGAIVVGRWTHVALTWDAGLMTLHVDGAVAMSGPLQVSYDAQDMSIGADIDLGTPMSFMTGAVDDVRLYNRVLSPSEIGLLAAP